MESFISIKNVSFSYGKAAVIDNISLEIEKGKFTALLGHNGCGKSTMAKLFNALLLPDEGTVSVDGIIPETEDDIYEINGYDEVIASYGYEDEDVQERLKRIGRKKVFVKFMCIEYHVWHPEHPTKHDLAQTRKLIDRNNELNVVRVEHGLDKHVDILKT